MLSLQPSPVSIPSEWSEAISVTLQERREEFSRDHPVMRRIVWIGVLFRAGKHWVDGDVDDALFTLLIEGFLVEAALPWMWVEFQRRSQRRHHKG